MHRFFISWVIVKLDKDWLSAFRNRAIMYLQKTGEASMKIATVGSGPIVTQVIQAAREVEGVEVIAVTSRSQERADRLAASLNVKKAYASFEAMLEDGEVDTVYIASPNSLHYAQALQAIAAKKHVIVEKPFAGNTLRAQEIFTNAKAQGVFVFEAITNIHLPHYQVIKNALSAIGPLTIASANYTQYSSRYDLLLAGEVPNVFNPNFSGGALADINVYNIHFMVGLFGKPKKVHYSARQFSNGIDTSGIVTMDYEDFNVSCIGAKDSVAPSNVCIQGEKGSIVIASPSSTIRKVLINTNHDYEEISIQDKVHLYYEFEAFEAIVRNNDVAAYAVLVQHTLDVVEVVEHARMTIGMHYDY